MSVYVLFLVGRNAQGKFSSGTSFSSSRSTKFSHLSSEASTVGHLLLKYQGTVSAYPKSVKR
jgi:hypothetical protein